MIHVTRHRLLVRVYERQRVAREMHEAKRGESHFPGIADADAWNPVT